MKIEKLFLPLFVFAAVVTVYLLFKNQENLPTQVVVPNTASSGVPSSYTQSGVVQPAVYNVPPISAVSTPPPTLLSSNPQSVAPAGGGPQQVPAYLTFNLGPQSDLNKQPASQGAATTSSGCGGCSGKKTKQCVTCKSKNSFTDGNSPTPMASSRAKAINCQPDDAWIAPWKNVMDYLKSTDVSGIPSIAGYQPSGELGTGPTNGTPWALPQGALTVIH